MYALPVGILLSVPYIFLNNSYLHFIRSFTCFQSWLLYCDFAGYSEIAAGAARLMGVRLMRNFDRPYLSQSYTEFFRRWHISLNRWFTSYVYIPLGGGRRGSTCIDCTSRCSSFKFLINF